MLPVDTCNGECTAGVGDEEQASWSIASDVRANRSQLGLIQAASYRHPATFTPETSSHNWTGLTQPVLNWPAGTHLPLPPDVGAMLNPAGDGACTDFTFDLFVRYGDA